VTSEGSASGRFTRAIKQGNLWAAELSAREMRGLSLHDALDLTVLIARSRPDRLERAAIRWHGRLELEAGVLTLRDSAAALAVLAQLPSDPEHAAALLRRILKRAHPTAISRGQ
jgi:hypothetical protein